MSKVLAIALPYMIISEMPLPEYTDTTSPKSKENGSKIKKGLSYKKVYSGVDPYKKPSNIVGRNEPCPCGSGKKHKKCCMNKTEQA